MKLNIPDIGSITSYIKIFPHEVKYNNSNSIKINYINKKPNLNIISDLYKFSYLKYGDVPSLEWGSQCLIDMVSLKLFDSMWRNPQKWAIVIPAYQLLETTAVLCVRDYFIPKLQKKINSMRKQFNLPKIYISSWRLSRDTISAGNFSQMKEANRDKALGTFTCKYKEPKCHYFIINNNKKSEPINIDCPKIESCLLIDDAIMYGTHLRQSIKSIMSEDIEASNIHAMFIVQGMKEMLVKHSIEDALNKIFRTSPFNEKLKMIKNEKFKITQRFLQWIVRPSEISDSDVKILLKNKIFKKKIQNVYSRIQYKNISKKFENSEIRTIKFFE